MTRGILFCLWELPQIDVVPHGAVSVGKENHIDCPAAFQGCHVCTLQRSHAEAWPLYGGM